MQGSYHFDLFYRNTKSELQAIREFFMPFRNVPSPIGTTSYTGLILAGSLTSLLNSSFHSDARQTSWASTPVAPASKPGIVVPAAAAREINNLRVRFFMGVFLRSTLGKWRPII